MKVNKIFAMFVALMMVGCNNTDIDLFDSPATDAGVGTLTNTQATISSLTFSWQPIEGVYQYGYTLTNNMGSKVRQGVTRETSIEFINLELDCQYVLKVEAFGTNGNPTTIMSMTASTLNKQQLAKPDVNKITVTISDGVVTFAWPAIENADYYDYTLTNIDDNKQVSSGSVNTNSLTINKLAIGIYQLSLTACSDNPGYPQSETALYTYQRKLEVLGEYTCVYTSYALGSSTHPIVKYEDGSYEIQSFYGVEGYDLRFTVGGGTIVVLNYVSEDGINKDVATGLAEYPTLTIKMDKKNCIYSPNTADGKRVKMNVQLSGYDSSGQDIFTWLEE